MRLPSLLAVIPLVVSIGGCEPIEEERYPIQEFIDDLYLRISPKSAEAGDRVTFFVDGEPPIKLRARRYVDLLSADGMPLFRLNSLNPRSGGPRHLAYPLPPSYSPPAAVIPLAVTQKVALPAGLVGGDYILQGEIVGLGGETRGTPTGSVRIDENDRVKD